MSTWVKGQSVLFLKKATKFEKRAYRKEIEK
jgi:hypothetical protein